MWRTQCILPLYIVPFWGCFSGLVASFLSVASPLPSFPIPFTTGQRIMKGFHLQLMSFLYGLFLTIYKCNSSDYKQHHQQLIILSISSPFGFSEHYFSLKLMWNIKRSSESHVPDMTSAFFPLHANSRLLCIKLQRGFGRTF